MIKILLISIFVWFISYSCLAQTPYLKHFTVEDGLPSSTVYTAFQDSSGVMWFGTENGITRFDGYQFETFNMSAINAATDIWGIKEDNVGRLWFSSQRQLTYLENDVFKAIPFPKKGGYTTIQRQFIDDKGNHFIRFDKSNLLHKVDLKQKRLVPFKDILLENVAHKLIFIKEDDKDIQWFFHSTGSEAFLITYKDSVVTNKDEVVIKKGNSKGIKHLMPTNHPSIYLFPTNDDFIQVDIERGKLSYIKNKLKGKYTISSNHHTINNLTILNLVKKEGEEKERKIVIDENLDIQKRLDFVNQFLINDLFKDKQGNIWICTKNEGIYFLPQKGRKSQIIGKTGTLINDDVTTLAVDKKDRIWFVNKDLELKVLKKDNTIHTIKFNLLNSTKPIYYFDDLKFDKKGNLYIGSNEDLFVIVPKEEIEGLLQKNSIDVLIKKPFFLEKVEMEKKIHFLSFAPVKALSTGDDNAFFVTSNLTISIQFAKDKIIINKLTNARAYAVAYWKDKLWIGRKDQLFTLNIHDKQKTAEPVTQFPYPINALETCKKDKLWIATDGSGLFRYNGTKTDTIKEFFDSRIKIKSLYVDSDNCLWIATNKGIGKVEVLSNEPFEYRYRMITKVYGLVSQEVNTVCKIKDKIYAATSKGLNIFNQKDLKKDTTNVPLFFTDFWVNNEKYSLQNPLRLSHKKNYIKIDYLCLSYSNMGDIEYDYMMTGVDKDWQQTTATFKEYPTLQPGIYTFKVRAKNLDGLITEIATLKFEIKLPWWRTWIAMIIFSLAILGLAYFIVNYRLEQEKDRNEKQRLEELNQLKSRFYSNITHEFRTPLTLIMGLTQQLKENANKSKLGIYNIIERHSYRLLNLINQLLDLSKLESKAMPLHYQNSDIITFVKYVVELFQSAANDKNIQLEFYTETDELFMDFDVDKIQSILFNLLSNAIKFTEENGQVTIHILTNETTKQLILKVQDTGIGINDDALAYIFNRYYQDKTRPQKGNNNTGIGLALVKELIEQMNGKIDVESNSNGTMFKIQLPMYQSDLSPVNKISSEDIPILVDAYFPAEKVKLTNPQIADEAEKPLLLLVEDDIDLMQYLESIIGQYYAIELAKDGKEGIEKAIEKVPDLIISDVMMPKKDGFELCQTLKKDERTSHIPIILLTAKTRKEDKLRGLKADADVYMIKPFHQEELFLRINQLLENRQVLQQRYQSTNLPKIKPIPETQKEDEFVLKVRAVIEANIDKYDLDVEFLCNQLHISRGQLHKKLRYLTSMSTRQFIKHIRIQKAEKLLKESNLNITEIAYETGFDAKYFSKVFREKYGKSPSKYRKELEV
ncbi:MAG: ATP-binding protein [Saprospiraceae bacterium]